VITPTSLHALANLIDYPTVQLANFLRRFAVWFDLLGSPSIPCARVEHGSLMNDALDHPNPIPRQ